MLGRAAVALFEPSSGGHGGVKRGLGGFRGCDAEPGWWRLLSQQLLPFGSGLSGREGVDR